MFEWRLRRSQGCTVPDPLCRLLFLYNTISFTPIIETDEEERKENRE